MSFLFPDWVIYLAGILTSIPSAYFFALDKKNRKGRIFSIIATALLIVAGIAIQISNDKVKERLAGKTPIFNGYLEPSNEEPLESTVPTDAISLYLGHDLRYGVQILTSSNNFNILTYQNTPFLAIGQENGKLWLSATIADSENKRVVTIIKNEFQGDFDTLIWPHSIL